MTLDPQHITYRRATVADLETLVDLRVRFLNEMYHHTDNAETDALRASLRAYFTEATASGAFVAWLAQHDGRTVGTSGMVVWRLPGRYGGLVSGEVGYILNLYTVPEARKNGICTRLLQELVGEARSLGLTYLHLHATEDGINIYRRMGFAEPDLVEMELKLGARGSARASGD
jgi:GNAT superfamily N-acetyltransferase